MKIKKTQFNGIYKGIEGKKRFLLTRNLIPSKAPFKEVLIKQEGKEFRVLDPKRSKLGAAILKGIKQLPIKEGDIVLYLGASYGYTTSFISDIIGEKGFVFALDFAPRVMRNLVFVCEDRKNMAPLFFDANQPQKYKDKITPEVDVIYMDIAQRNQAEIFLKNIDMFLKKDSYALLAVKSRSINVVEKPRKIFEEVRKKLEKHLKIIDFKMLEPFEKDHCIFVCKK